MPCYPNKWNETLAQMMPPNVCYITYQHGGLQLQLRPPALCSSTICLAQTPDPPPGPITQLSVVTFLPPSKVKSCGISGLLQLHIVSICAWRQKWMQFLNNNQIVYKHSCDGPYLQIGHLNEMNIARVLSVTTRITCRLDITSLCSFSQQCFIFVTLLSATSLQYHMEYTTP